MGFLEVREHPLIIAYDKIETQILIELSIAFSFVLNQGKPN